MIIAKDSPAARASSGADNPLQQPWDQDRVANDPRAGYREPCGAPFRPPVPRAIPGHRARHADQGNPGGFFGPESAGAGRIRIRTATDPARRSWRRTMPRGSGVPCPLRAQIVTGHTAAGLSSQSAHRLQGLSREAGSEPARASLRSFQGMAVGDTGGKANPAQSGEASPSKDRICPSAC